MMHAVLARDLGGIVSGAIVDDQPFDRVETGDLARQLGQRDGQRLGLVKAGDLDDEFHGGLFLVREPNRYVRTTVPFPRLWSKILAARTCARFEMHSISAPRPSAFSIGRSRYSLIRG